LYKKEKEMYEDVCEWLKNTLNNKFKKAERITVADTSEKVLSKWLIEMGFHKFFPDYQTYEIQVDVTGVILEKDQANLAFVECKLDKMNLRDLSQLIGYSKVARPAISILLSPKGLSDSMNLLFNVFRRNDILFYSPKRFILIARWDETRKEIDMSSLIPKGSSHILI